MIAYHLDRSNHLRSGQTLNYIYPETNPSNSTISLYGFEKVSYWGLQCFNYLKEFSSSSSELLDISNLNDFQIELQAENIRRAYFPSLPSRFKSLFAFENTADINLWGKILCINDSSSLYQIETDSNSCVKLDASYLRGGIGADSESVFQSLYKYWSGKFSPNPLPELIIELPIKVICKIELQSLVSDGLCVKSNV